MSDKSVALVSQTAMRTAASDRPPFGSEDDIRLERKAPDRNILDRGRIVDAIKQWGVVIVFAAIITTFTILEPTTFLTQRNVVNILNNSPSLVLFSIAATIALIIGEFDLSFAAVADLACVIFGVLVTTFGWTSNGGILFAAVVGLVCGILIGAINGLFVARVFVPSFVATLAVGSIAAGLELASQGFILHGTKQISQIVLPSILQNLGSATVAGTSIKWSVAVAFLIAGVFWILMRRTTPGRRAYAIGGNPMAAYLAGVPVAALRIAAFALIGAIAALAGVMVLGERGYFNMASPPLLLQAYTAAFLGAAVFAKKKRFDVLGSLFSVFVLLVLSNGLSLMNQPRWIASAISGVVLLIAVVLNRPQNRKV
jgi:ribose transport system permease protein